MQFTRNIVGLYFALWAASASAAVVTLDFEVGSGTFLAGDPNLSYEYREDGLRVSAGCHMHFQQRTGTVGLGFDAAGCNVAGQPDPGRPLGVPFSGPAQFLGQPIVYIDAGGGLFSLLGFTTQLDIPFSIQGSNGATFAGSGAGDVNVINVPNAAAWSNLSYVILRCQCPGDVGTIYDDIRFDVASAQREPTQIPEPGTTLLIGTLAFLVLVQATRSRRRLARRSAVPALH
jgi:hypothetical protein